MKPKLRDHYHAHRLSFWLNLIPTLHRSAASETTARHHQLEDHDNPLSYDGVYRQRPLKELHPSLIYTTTPYITTELLIGDHLTGTVELSSSTEVTGLLSTAVSNDTDTLAMTMQQATYSTVLTITIVFGCCILAVNSLICCAIYYKKDKNNAECLQKREYQVTIICIIFYNTTFGKIL
ncbi:uncharacterized protein TNCT_465131 [Trichonephila clavata]|uniref:Uncharacterized protein n=1 Tax=Trichonephila clavata TaxID=2740835 RepID=A0A8X6FZP2_TRICU|nr:uncharacterized protein TNCT_465131 [Trichonephila clavata]